MGAWWGDLPASAFSKIDPEATIAVLPVAAVEQHGPHLPLSTDVAIMAGMLDTVLAALPASLDARVLPVQSVGKSDEHLRLPGTLSLSAENLIRAWTELGEAVARTGIRKIVVVTSHGGNEEVMAIVTRELRLRFDMLAVKSSWNRFGRPAGLFSDEENRLGIHGGDYETSLMLHFRPDLVDMALAADFPSRVSEADSAFALLRQTGTHAFAWLAEDLNPQGVVGQADRASAEKGRLVAEHQAAGFIALLEDMRAARLADWLR
ncbi:MAG: creatininase [Mesorhizobium amorphae]|nr:MAG: creatininase [Mesorhizobium amorphae]